MQAKKAKQLMKARLCRERQIYEMRKRAELKAAVSELERPWEVVEREEATAAPNLFSIKADEQVKVLADRFQRPGGFDLWSERDGPVLFESPDELPSARFFPKGVVHSVKPYRRVDGYGLVKDGGGDGDGIGERGLLKGNDFGGGLRELGVLGCRCKGVSLRELREMLLRNERRKKGGENFIKSVIVFLLNNGRWESSVIVSQFFT